jgi:large subunit ribosomal protein L13
MKTYVARNESIQRCWYVIDADSLKLGRLAVVIASYLRGKHKPEYTPHVDTGDYVIVINAEKIIVTGNKEKNKIYYSHTGYPGGIKKINYGDLNKKLPQKAIRLAVKGMMPRGPLGREMLKKLKVYVGEAHRHAAQQPQRLDFRGMSNVV